MARKTNATDMLAVIEVMEPNGRPLRGMRICITGHLSITRTEWVQVIKSAGGEFHDNVTGSTTHLVTNADWTAGSIKGNASNKFKKAHLYGVKIINEQQLMDMIIKADTEAHAG